MIIKVENTDCIQICSSCGAKNIIGYSTLKAEGKFIKLPLCPSCGKSLEILCLGDSLNEYARIVAHIFAKVVIK